MSNCQRTLPECGLIKPESIEWSVTDKVDEVNRLKTFSSLDKFLLSVRGEEGGVISL